MSVHIAVGAALFLLMSCGGRETPIPTDMNAPPDMGADDMLAVCYPPR